MVPYFHEPQASENTAHECNIQAILHDQPLNDVFILYLVNIIIILMNNDCLTRFKRSKTMLRGCRLSFKCLSNGKKSEEILLGSYLVLFRLLIFMAKWPRRLFTSLVRTSSIFLTSRLSLISYQLLMRNVSCM